jgi:hypothetical protein
MKRLREKRTTLREELEIKRIQSEIAKNEEETIKVQFEREQLQKEAERPWYRKKQLYHSALTILVLVTVLWFYVEKLLTPMIQADNIKLTLDNERVRADLFKTQNEFATKEQAFIADNLEKLRELRSDNERLRSDKRDLAARYNSLSNSLAISNTEADRYRRQYNIVSKEIAESENKISDLNDRIKLAEQVKGYSSYLSLPAGISGNSYGHLNTNLNAAAGLPSFQNWMDSLSKGQRLYGGYLFSQKATDSLLIRGLTLDSLLRTDYPTIGASFKPSN